MAINPSESPSDQQAEPAAEGADLQIVPDSSSEERKPTNGELVLATLRERHRKDMEDRRAGRPITYTNPPPHDPHPNSGPSQDLPEQK